MPSTVGIRLGACSARYKIQQLEALLQQKTAELQKLARINRVLSQREQLVSRFIAQQGDMLYHLGRLVFTIPETRHEEYEQKATAAISALLKDMEAARLLQAVESMAPAYSVSKTAPVVNTDMQGSTERLTSRVLRTFLEQPNYVQIMRKLHGASLEELAEIIHKETMQLGFAVSRYPSERYIDPVEFEGIEDPLVRSSKQQAAARLQEALDTITTTLLLLHLVADKVLNLSMINLETMQLETPAGSFWEAVADKLELRPNQISQLHTGFVWYNQKRSVLTHQMQQTMVQLQQLLGPNEQQQPQALAGELAGNDSARADATGVVAALRSNSDQSSKSAAELSTASWSAGGSSSGTGIHAHSASYISTSSGGSLLHGGLASDMIESMEAADQLLQRLGQLVWQLREVSRCLIFQFANVLDPYQLSVATIHSWPFIMQPPPIIEVIVKREVQRQEQEEQEEQEQ